MVSSETTEIAVRLAQQLDAAQQITHIGSWQWNVASGEVTWSDELYRIYGFAPRSVGVTFEWFVGRLHPEDRERIPKEVNAALERGGRFAYRERIVRPDGSVRELDTVGDVLTGAGGRPTGVIGTCRDITEERRRDETIRLYADVVDNVQIGLSVWRLDQPGDAASLRLVAFNPATEAATGVALGTSVGKTLPAIFPTAMATELPALLAGVDAATPVRELSAYAFEVAPGARTYAVKAFVLPDRCVGLALEDVTERTRAQRLQAGERRALEMLAAGAPLVDILATIVGFIETLTPGAIASILMLDAGGKHVRAGAAPRLPEAYNRALDGAAIGPRAGSCGSAAFLRTPVFVADIDTDDRWADYGELRQLLAPLSLRACWSSPILAADEHVLGTFALYCTQPGLPDQPTRELMARAAHVASIAIERRQLDDQLRALTARIEAVREEERTGIAREIHDQLGQALTALKMDIAWLARRLPGGEGTVAKLAEMSRAADEIIGSVRRISAELRPGVLDDLGLEAAIEWQAEEFAKRTGVPCEVHAGLGELPLERGLATGVFRIFQEALTNVARHANASAVAVELHVEDGELRLEVSDDGAGLPAGTARSGSLGLLGMRERARRLGGDCVVQGRVPRGTTVAVTVPLPRAA